MQRVHLAITALEDRFKIECPEVDRMTIHPSRRQIICGEIRRVRRILIADSLTYGKLRMEIGSVLTNDADKCDPIKRKCVFSEPNPFFMLGLLMVSLSEANLIYKLWIKPKYPVDPLAAFGLQIFF